MSTKSKLTKRTDPKEWYESRDLFPTIARSDFFSSFYDFQQELANILKNFYRSLPVQADGFTDLTLNPSLDIVEDDKHFKVELEMPGVDENDIKVTIENQNLIIKASKETSKKDEEKNYTTREISYGAYERIIPLPDEAIIDEAESTFKKGMLWVSIPKKPVDKSKVSEVEIKKAS